MKKNILFLFIILGLIFDTSAQITNKATIDATNKNLNTISKFIYSQFSEHLGNCIYDGIWVGENSKIPNQSGVRSDVVEALRKIQVPALRWPGGCFADEYHWKDGIGLKKERPKMINTNWGGVTEDNSFGTHEFMNLCQQLDCEAFISGNLGSGTVQEMSQWVEYLNSDNESPMTELRKKNGRDNSWGVKFWGVGNETWGCGGHMKPKFYADQAVQFSTFLKNYGSSNLKQIVVGPNATDYDWTDVLMRETGTRFWGMSLHYYTRLNASATNFKEDEWFKVMQSTLKMNELINKHSAIMDKYDPYKNVGLVVDEWGTWYDVEPNTNPGFLYQQNSLRDALVAGVNLNIFNNHCDRVKMTCIAQVLNVLQSIILTKGEKILFTPTYYVYDLYKVHQDAYLIPSELSCENYSYEAESVPALNMSSSIDNSGKMHITICNLHATKVEKLSCDIKGYNARSITGKIVTANKLNTYNSFDEPNQITDKVFSDFKLKENQVNISIPPHSVIMLELEGILNIESQPTVLKNPVKGIQYKLYNGDWNSIPDYKNLRPTKTGLVNNIVFPEGTPGGNFFIVYDAFIKIEKDGFYNFSILSDDGSKLFIDNQNIINNDGRHGAVEREGITYLKKGFYPFRLEYFQGGGGRVLELNKIIKVNTKEQKNNFKSEDFWYEK